MLSHKTAVIGFHVSSPNKGIDKIGRQPTKGLDSSDANPKAKQYC